MKITIRIPNQKVPYAYYEVEYESIEEYKKNHPDFARVMSETQKKAKECAELSNNKQTEFDHQ